MTDRTPRSSYDEVPYPSFATPHTHPDCLATLATLFGLHPPPLERCRVLELGCSDGGNLIPIAHALPATEFLGVDSSAREVADGQAAVQALGLRNIRLKHQDILDVTAEVGRFDYIICHGIFSWVPDPVREKILEICSRCLTPNGVAYVSYNTYPGWHMRGMIRDMMAYHTRRINDLSVRAARARALLDFLATSVPAGGPTRVNPYHALLASELELLRSAGDTYIVHEFLEDVNEPIYFHQFAERAARHGLQYLAEAEFGTMPSPDGPSGAFARRPEYLGLEQYMDFLRNRKFRQTLVCHQGLPVERPPKIERLSRLSVSSPARPEPADVDLACAALVTFRIPGGAAVSTDLPLAKAALLTLADLWPRALPFETLAARARARTDAHPAPHRRGAGAPPSDVEVLGQLALRSYAMGLVRLHVREPGAIGEVTECPLASGLVRFQAARGPLVTNAFHETVHMNDEVSYQVLRHLDGRHDRAALQEALVALAATGGLTVRSEGEPLTDLDRLRSLLPDLIDRSLSDLARQALLVG